MCNKEVFALRGLHEPILLVLYFFFVLKPSIHNWANILGVTDTFAYRFGFPDEYYKVTIIINEIEVLPFVGL